MLNTYQTQPQEQCLSPACPLKGASSMRAEASPQSKSCESYSQQAFLKSWLSKNKKATDGLQKKLSVAYLL
jgi:hypothetical protein